jgi:hypothetical protein
MFGNDFFDPREYLAPKNEEAILKNVPVELRDHPFIKFMTSTRGFGCRVRYPETGDNRYLAKTFSVYPY